MMFDKKEKESTPTKETSKKPLDLSFNLMDRLKKLGLSKLICILAAGVLVLMFLSEFMPGTTDTGKITTESEGSSNKNVQKSSESDEYRADLEHRLEQEISEMEGVGEAKVSITLKSSKKSVVLTNKTSSEETTDEQDSAGGSRKSSSKNSKEDAVFQQNESGASVPYKTQEYEPEIQGVLVIADGGGNEVVKSDIIEALEAVLDVPAHKIVVKPRKQK